MCWNIARFKLLDFSAVKGLNNISWAGKGSHPTVWKSCPKSKSGSLDSDPFVYVVRALLQSFKDLDKGLKSKRAINSLKKRLFLLNECY